jgi:hypothetical protein
LLDLVEDALRMIQKEILRHSSYNSLGATWFGWARVVVEYVDFITLFKKIHLNSESTPFVVWLLLWLDSHLEFSSLLSSRLRKRSSLKTIRKSVMNIWDVCNTLNFLLSDVDLLLAAWLDRSIKVEVL